MLEGIITDAGHAIGDCYTSEATAITEGIRTYTGHTIGYCDTSEATAINEGTFV